MCQNKRNNIVINGFFFSLYRVVNVLFPLITAVYVARILLPDGIGRVVYAQNVVTYFTLLSSLGLPTYGTREIARNLKSSEECNRIFHELFLINALSTTVCVILYYFLCFTVAVLKKELCLYLVAGLAIVLNYFNIDWLYQGREEYKYIAIRGVLVKALSVLLLFIVVKEPSDYIAYAGIHCLVLGGNNFVNCIGLKHRVKLKKYNLCLRRHIKPILILFGTTIAIELYTMLDTTMIGLLCSEQMVGYYSYAMKTTKIIITVLGATTTVLLPRLSSYYNISKMKYSDLANKGVLFLLFVSVPITVFLFLNANDIVLFLYGRYYEETIITLKILSLLIVPVTFSTYFGTQILCSANMEKYMFVAVSVGACTNIFMNAILIPRFNQNGAAIASVVSELLVTLVDLFFVRKVVKVHISTWSLLKISIASIAIAMGTITVHLFFDILFIRLLLVGLVMALIFVLIFYKMLK